MTDHNADLKKYLSEARQLDDPNISYSEKKVKGALDRVIAVLAGSKSAVATKMAQTYRNIQRHEKELVRLREEHSMLIKSVQKDFFDPSDEVLTRVLESVQFTITYTKVTQTPARTTSKVDYEAAMAELAEQLPELDEVLAVLIKRHTTTTTKAAKDNPSRLLVKHHDEIKGQSKTPKKAKVESINEGPSDDQWVTMYANISQKRFDRFDELLRKLEPLE